MKNIGSRVITRSGICVTEVWVHCGELIIKSLHEQLRDGMMSPIDCKFRVEKIKGDKEEGWVLMTWNGKFLPYIEQTAQG